MSIEATVNYIFRSKFDSSSSEKNAVEKELEDLINNTNESELYQKENINILIYILEKKLLDFKYMHRNKKKDSERLRLIIEQLSGLLGDRLRESKQLLNSALLADRKLTGETFTSIIPLTYDYVSDSSTATLKDTIIMGIEKDKMEGEEYINISGINITGEEHTVVKVNSRVFPYTLEMHNKIRSYSQVKIDISTVIREGIFNLEFEESQVISILDSNNFELVPKHVTKQISLPVTFQTNNFKIRFFNNEIQKIKINKATYTDKIYIQEVTYESKKLAIEENLSQVVIDTCDNYSDPNVDIQYFIRFNTEEYQSLRPLNKFKINLEDKYLQSIVLTDRYIDNEIIKIEENILEDGVFKFEIENLQVSVNKLRGFNKKLGDNLYSLEKYINKNSYTINIFNKEEIEIVLNKDQSITLNNDLIQAKDKNLVLKLQKGFNRLEVDKTLWKEPVDLESTWIKEIKEDSLVVVDRETEEIREIPYIFNTLQASTNSIYLQLLESESQVFIEEIEMFKKVSKTDTVEYIYKSDPNPIYIASYSRKKEINSIQLKAVMKSKDKRTCPFISRIILKGV